MFVLMRHGVADWQAPSDAQRPLTLAGRQSLESLYHSRSIDFQAIERVVVSPYLRALQSAAIMAVHLEAEFIVDPRLTPDSTINEMMAALEEHWAEQLLVMTHQPLIGKLISYLELGHLHSPEPVMPGDAYFYDLPWPGANCALRQHHYSAF